MTKQLCIMHANCQGEPLLERLRACPEFHARYDCILYTNYIREHVPDDKLAQCDLFLYQFLGPGWDDLASTNLLAKLPPSATHLCIPNMFFKGYWPFWSGEPGFNYRCTHLDAIIGMGLPEEETVLLYLRSDVTRKFDLLDLVSQTITQEREREAHTPIKYVDTLVENYRERRLFNTVNHPNAFLMNHAAQELLRQLDFEPPSDAELGGLGEPFPEFEQPINPKVADHFGWDFATGETQYNIYGRHMTHARYVANYVTCQKAGIEDFIGYLQGEYIDL